MLEESSPNLVPATLVVQSGSAALPRRGVGRDGIEVGLHDRRHRAVHQLRVSLLRQTLRQLLGRERQWPDPEAALREPGADPSDGDRLAGSGIRRGPGVRPLRLRLPGLRHHHRGLRPRPGWCRRRHRPAAPLPRCPTALFVPHRRLAQTLRRRCQHHELMRPPRNLRQPSLDRPEDHERKVHRRADRDRWPGPPPAAKAIQVRGWSQALLGGQLRGCAPAGRPLPSADRHPR